MNTQTTKGKTLLLIDDDKLLLEIYTKRFIEAGYAVVTKEDANDHDDPFVDSVCKISPDMLITNLTMSGRDGFKAIELLRKDERTKDLPIVVLTNRGASADIAHADKLKVLGYIIKAAVIPADVVKEIGKLLLQRPEQ